MVFDNLKLHRNGSYREILEIKAHTSLIGQFLFCTVELIPDLGLFQ